jgi:antirestriction protein ArdC
VILAITKESKEMDRRETARRFVDFLRAGNAPWRHPYHRLPEFEPLFGKFFRGEPQSVAEADYAVVDAITGAVGVKVRHHWNCRRPRYWRDQDRIVMPLKSYFQDEAHYQATRLHEVFHAVENRVGWAGPGHIGELIAEAGTAMLLSQLLLPHDSDDKNINKWLPWWAMEITFDPAYLFDAIAHAERATNYLLGLQRRKEAA